MAESPVSVGTAGVAGAGVVAGAVVGTVVDAVVAVVVVGNAEGATIGAEDVAEERWGDRLRPLLPEEVRPSLALRSRRSAERHTSESFCRIQA